jgi:regulatory protein
VHLLPRITALDSDPRRPDSFRVEIDGAKFGAIAGEVVDAEHLSVGREVDPALQDRLVTAADREAAYRTTLRALEMRSYARTDLGRRLLRKGHPRAAVDAALDRAASLGLLDDAAFVEHYVQTRSARGRGPSRLLRDLLAMGIDRAIVDRAIASEWPDGPEHSEIPLALAQKRSAQLGGLPPQVRRRRVVAYLARRGFSGRHISDMIDQVVARKS